MLRELRRYAINRPRGNRKATFQSLEYWNDSNGLPGYAKASIERIFEDAYGWQVINPPADGFCGLHAVSVGSNLIKKNKLDDDTLRPLIKEVLLEDVEIGIEIYAETRRIIINDLAKYSGRAGDNALIDEITNAYTDTPENIEDAGRNIAIQNVEKYIVKNLLLDSSLNRNITEMLISMLESMPTYFKNKPINDQSYFEFDIYNTDHWNEGRLTPIKERQLSTLLDQGTIDIFFISFLAYCYECNFIVLFYDSRAAPHQQFICNSVTYINYAIAPGNKIKNDIIVQNSRNYSTAVSRTSLLFNNGHYQIFYYPEVNVREQLISKFIARKYDDADVGYDDYDNPKDWDQWGWGSWQDSGPTTKIVMNVSPEENFNLGAAIKKRKKQGKKQKQRLTQRQQQKQTQRQRQRQRQQQKQTQRQRQPRRTR
jgi:hypothetical protein